MMIIKNSIIVGDYQGKPIGAGNNYLAISLKGLKILNLLEELQTFYDIPNPVVKNTKAIALTLKNGSSCIANVDEKTYYHFTVLCTKSSELNVNDSLITEYNELAKKEGIATEFIKSTITENLKYKDRIRKEEADAKVLQNKEKVNAKALQKKEKEERSRIAQEQREIIKKDKADAKALRNKEKEEKNKIAREQREFIKKEEVDVKALRNKEKEEKRLKKNKGEFVNWDGSIIFGDYFRRVDYIKDDYQFYCEIISKSSDREYFLAQGEWYSDKSDIGGDGYVALFSKQSMLWKKDNMYIKQSCTLGDGMSFMVYENEGGNEYFSCYGEDGKKLHHVKFTSTVDNIELHNNISYMNDEETFVCFTSEQDIFFKKNFLKMKKFENCHTFTPVRFNDGFVIVGNDGTVDKIDFEGNSIMQNKLT